MRKIITVVGARPQFVKAAAVSKAIRESSQFAEVMVHTGQHYDENMSLTFFAELDMGLPAYNLGVAGASHALQISAMLNRLEPLMIEENPDAVLVYGDTNSTLAGALAAAKLNLPIAHIEAGLRSFNRRMPEEINRVLTDHISSVLFCPTAAAVTNLEREGIVANVWNTGDVMYDAALQFAAKSKEKSSILRNFGLRPEQFILATVHRAENTDSKEYLSNILSALKTIAEQMTVVFPIHPRTRKMCATFGLENEMKEFVVIDPVGFLDMVALESNARLIVTDSGGVQKEAYFHKVPCVTLRGETEWVETIEAKWNMLASVETVNGILQVVRTALAFSGERAAIHDYGDGTASHQIVHGLNAFLQS